MQFARSSPFVALGAFAAGLALAAGAGLAPGRPLPAPLAGAPAPPPASCVDTHAMLANANLVSEAHTQHGELRAAREEAERARVLAKAGARSALRLADDLGMASEDWAEAARSGAFLLRLPCATPRQRGTVQVVRPRQRRTSLGPGRTDVNVRAEAAGLSAEELGTIDEAYAVAHARTWAKIATTCDTLARTLEVEEAEREEPPPPAARVASCKELVVGSLDRATVGRLADLRSAGRPAVRSEGEERIVLALAESAEEVARALTETLGREKATRAMTFGLACFDEVLVFAPERKPGDDGS